MHITAQGPAVSEMTYTVSSETLNSTIPYHTNRQDDWTTTGLWTKYAGMDGRRKYYV